MEGVRLALVRFPVKVVRFEGHGVSPHSERPSYVSKQENGAHLLPT